MIKLRLLLEVNYFGFYYHSGMVDGVPVYSEQDVTHSDLRMIQGDRWRYHDRLNEVSWTTEPQSMDAVFAVNKWLAKKGVSPKSHYYQNDEIWSADEG